MFSDMMRRLTDQASQPQGKPDLTFGELAQRSAVRPQGPMRYWPSLFIVVAIASSAPAQAADKRLQRSLEKLEPGTRMMEVCDMEAARRISQQKGYSGVDRVVSDARETAVTSGEQVTASGAAFRRGGRWYGLKYTCTLAPGHTATKALKFTIGREIPHANWEEYGLWE
jgi:hypothetical protein